MVDFRLLINFHIPLFGKAWFATDWIPELVFAALYRAGQWRAVTEIVAVTCALISGALSFYLARKLRLSVALGLTAIIVALISPHFLARPVIFSYLLLTVWIVLILEIEDRNEWAGSRGFILVAHYASVGQRSWKFHIRIGGFLFIPGQCGIQRIR